MRADDGPVLCGSHVVPLNMGGRREDASNWRNQPPNIAGLCVACDRWFEALRVPARKREVTKWIDAGTWQASDVLPGHGSRRSSS
jgi:hypothetical protein